MIQTYLAHWFIFSSKVITQILPLLQKSKKCCGHYSTIHHVTLNVSSLIKRCDHSFDLTMFEFLYQKCSVSCLFNNEQVIFEEEDEDVKSLR